MNNFIFTQQTSFTAFHHFLQKQKHSSLNPMINFIYIKKNHLFPNILKYANIYKLIVVYYMIQMCNRTHQFNLLWKITGNYSNSTANNVENVYNFLFTNFIKQLILVIITFVQSVKNPYYLSEIRKIVQFIMSVIRHKPQIATNKNHIAILQKITYNQPCYNRVIAKNTHSDIAEVRILTLIVQELSYEIKLPISVHDQVDNLLINLHLEEKSTESINIFSIYRNGLICEVIYGIYNDRKPILDMISMFDKLSKRYNKNKSTKFMHNYLYMTLTVHNNNFVHFLNRNNPFVKQKYLRSSFHKNKQHVCMEFILNNSILFHSPMEQIVKMLFQ